MATKVLTNGFFKLNAVDLSDHMDTVTLNYLSEMLDETAWGDANRIMKAGLKNWSLQAVLQQDYAAASVEATLFPLIGTTACFELRPENACSSANNPIYSGICILKEYTPVAGAIGTLMKLTANFDPASALSRASSS